MGLSNKRVKKTVTVGRKRKEGVHNKIYFGEMGGKEVAVKVGKPNVPTQKKKDEYAISKLAFRYGLAPEPFFYDTERNVFVVRRVRGRRIKFTKNNLVKLAKMLSKLHSKEFNRFGFPKERYRGNYGNNFNWFVKWIDDYIVKLRHQSRKSRAKSSKVIDFIEERVRLLKRDFIRNIRKFDGNQFVLIHFDLHPKNIIARGDDIKIVDWEHGQTGDPAIDVARLFLISNLTDEQKRLFISSYSTKDPNFEHRLRKYSELFSLLDVIFFVRRNYNELFSATSSIEKSTAESKLKSKMKKIPSR